jgi:hypothetical protein
VFSGALLAASCVASACAGTACYLSCRSRAVNSARRSSVYFSVVLITLLGAIVSPFLVATCIGLTHH